MRNLGSLISILVLVVAACSSGVDPTPTTGGAAPLTTVADETGTTVTSVDEAETTTTTSAPDETTITSDRPLAPDFTLELGDGGSYTLSEGARPVYLIFWAEW